MYAFEDQKGPKKKKHVSRSSTKDADGNISM